MHVAEDALPWFAGRELEEVARGVVLEPPPGKPSPVPRSENVHCKYRGAHRTKRPITASKDLAYGVDMLAYLYIVVD